ncbi:MAG TPA: hypothetical protein VLK65_21620 [Vicinamibacteria bacterium]|nr:hypothetical protein [Vicinamibacteria bacterium]
MKVERLLVLGIAMWIMPRPSAAQAVSVTYETGLLTIQCQNAPLSEVFETIEREAGIELTLEDPVKSKRLTADLNSLPVAMAVQRLLEGAGVNYIVMMDPFDWGTVDKIFIGTGGGGPARSAAPPPRAEPEPVEEPAYDETEAVDPGDQLDPALEDPGFVDDSQNTDEFVDPNDPGAFPTPPPPNYLPPTQNFPRSRYTPGLPNNQPYQVPQQPQPDPNAAAGAFPYLDPFGRPIPAPPNQEQQQRRQQRQQQQQQ